MEKISIVCTIEYLDVDSTSTSGKERTVRPSVGFFFSILASDGLKMVALARLC